MFDAIMTNRRRQVPEIREQIDPEVYRQHLSLMEIALDVEKISQALARLRTVND
jgi:hypothetical protein